MSKLYHNVLPIFATIIFFATVGVMLFFGEGLKLTTSQKLNISKNNLPPEDTSKELAIYLKPQNNSKQAGSASLLENNGKVLVGITTTGEPKNVIQSAGIYTGTCEVLEKLNYPLTNIENGSSQTTLETTISNLQNLGPFVISINKIPTTNQNSISCANLELSKTLSPSKNVMIESNER